MKNLIATTTALIILSVASIATAGTSWQQGFETDTSGWTELNGTITQVASGTDGVVSSDGSYHAVISMPDVDDSNNGGGAYVDPTFPGRDVLLSPGFGKFIYSVDVYMDPAAGSVGDVWTLEVGFKVDGNYSGEFDFFGRKTAENTCTLGRQTENHEPVIQITEAGWYTLTTEWTETAGGIIDYNRIYKDGTEVWNGSSLSAPYALGNNYTPGYSWFFSRDNTSPTLAIDNLCYESVPEPGTFAMLGLGALSMLIIRRKRQA